MPNRKKVTKLPYRVTTFAEASQNFATIDRYIRALNEMLENWRKSGLKDLALTDTRKLKHEFPKKSPGPADGVKPPPKWP